MTAVHSTGPLRDHRRRFRIGGAADATQLRNALRTLEQHDEAIGLAFVAMGIDNPEESLSDVKAALKLLVHGERAQFR